MSLKFLKAKHNRGWSKFSLMLIKKKRCNRFSLVLSHPFPLDWVIGMAWPALFDINFLNFIVWCSVVDITQQVFDFVSLVLSHPFSQDWIIRMTWVTLFEIDFLNFIIWCSTAHLTQEGFNFAKEISNGEWFYSL